VPTPREQLSEAMRNARLEAGFDTHSKLAKHMHLSRPAISRAESANQPVPSDVMLAAWARACRVPVEEFTEIVQRAKSGTPEWFGPRQKQVIGRARVTAVIDHRVLAHAIGSAQVMAEQCGHIASLVERELVTLHVVSEGANAGLGGALALASNKSLVTVKMTTMTREITSTEAGMVEEAQAAFEMILGMALPPVPSLEYVKEREAAWKER